MILWNDKREQLRSFSISFTNIRVFPLKLVAVKGNYSHFKSNICPFLKFVNSCSWRKISAFGRIKARTLCVLASLLVFELFVGANLIIIASPLILFISVFHSMLIMSQDKAFLNCCFFYMFSHIFNATLDCSNWQWHFFDSSHYLLFIGEINK